MKKLLITILIMSFLTQNVLAEMRYNPINNLIYSHPETPDINQIEYRLLILACIQIEARMMLMNGGKQPSKKDVLKQCKFYLKSIGTRTALRLISDLKSNNIYYVDGSFMKKIFAY